MTGPNITLESRAHTVRLHPETGAVVSLTAKTFPTQEFIAWAPEHPVFVIQYLDEQREYQTLDSRGTSACEISQDQSGETDRVTVRYADVANMDIDVTLTITVSEHDDKTRFRLRLRNGAGLRIVDVQYPFVVCPYSLGGEPKSETAVVPWGFGQIIRSPTYSSLGPDDALTWRISSVNGSIPHYPGGHFAQFLAYHNNRAGILLSTEDTEGRIKLFQMRHRDPGIRLGVAHVGDWPCSEGGERTIEYDTAVTVFEGDWYDAAERYREWSLRQHWAVPLTSRTDVPEWLLESPVHVTIRPQGIEDMGPVKPVEEFLPYEKCLPLLEGIAEKVDAPLVAVIMGWERGGSWVYPDCFPPIGGDESLKRFATACREKGWRVGSFCNGTRWVLRHRWNDYDGWDHFRERHGIESVCREADLSPWRNDWVWRQSMLGCSASSMTREIATDFVQRLLDWGLESIQFFDQNCGASTFACFSEDHGHPSIPGKWMSDAMESLVGDFRKAAEEAGEPEVIQSVEMCCNEFALQLFQQSDSRVRPPGHDVKSGEVVPLYQFLFHECIIMHGMMSPGPEPFHVEIANAANGVYGEIPGGVLTGYGTLLDKDTYNWAEWDPRVGDSERGLQMIKSVVKMRHGPGREFLVYGRMQKPSVDFTTDTIEWEYEGKRHKIPAVFYTAWTNVTGRFAVVAANWTDAPRELAFFEPRLGSDIEEFTTEGEEAKVQRITRSVSNHERIIIEMTPLSMYLVVGR